MTVTGRWCLAGAGAVSLGVVAPSLPGAVAAAVICWLAVRRFLPSGAAVLAVLVMAGGVSGAVADRRAAADLPTSVAAHTGRFDVRLREDPSPRWDGLAVGAIAAIDGVRWNGPAVAVGPGLDEATAGDTVVVEATVRPGPRRLGRHEVVGTVEVDEVVALRSNRSPVFVMGNAVRSRVREAFPRGDPVDALIAGLVIGDTTHLPAGHEEDLRRAGLAHFVAVSGSNVALFLGAWWIVTMPVAIHPRLRVATGLVGLAVFVVATRWEPSVVRASAMALVPLLGGLVGVPVDAWMALGVATGALLLVSADLATSIGFLLSVLATAGVLVGVRAVRGRAPGWLWVPLGATVGAQAAVAPLLLAVFGSIPLVAPITNLVAAPVVSLTTVFGLASVMLPLPVLASGARIGAAALLAIAERGAGGPQLGWLPFLAVAALTVVTAMPRSRPLGMALVCATVLVMPVDGVPWPSTPTVVVLDIGQGDAILLKDPSGHAMLVDGGRDPRSLDRALRRHRVSRLDILAVTHGDLDHVGGLVDLLAKVDVDEVWIARFATRSEALDDVLADATRAGVPVREVGRGTSVRLGAMTVDVVGPARRYLADNDGSIVLLASWRRSILLPADVEAIAQRELPALRPDVMVVPHHGSSTTDLDWLERTVGQVAVLSYGENTYGHPHPDVLAALDEARVMVHHTMREGDVTIPLG